MQSGHGVNRAEHDCLEVFDVMLIIGSAIGNSTPDASMVLRETPSPDALNVAYEHQRHLGGHPGCF